MGDIRGLTEKVTQVQPYAAKKRYTCPYCSGPIEIGQFHLVVIPDDTAELRRHWHRGCWFRELRARPSAASID